MLLHNEMYRWSGGHSYLGPTVTKVLFDGCIFIIFLQMKIEWYRGI